MTQISINNKTQTIGTSSALVSEEKRNPYSERMRLILTNTSTGAQNITVSVDAEAVAGAGIMLYPGGSISWEKQTSLIPLQQLRVNAISSAVGGTLAVYEEVKQ